ncbi:MAG: metal-dependent transcriptional regulator [Candidatus Acidiferrales bacterium]
MDHMLEEIWILLEEGNPPSLERISPNTMSDPQSVAQELTSRGLLELRETQLFLTPRGRNRARDVVRRRRLAERLFTDTFSIEDSEADSQACKFEHIITPELDEKICTFLGHPSTCPHGNPIPPGPCCGKHSR